jgi:integrase
MKVWTPEQADAFLISARKHPAHALYMLALTTGMRQGELLGLRWQDVDLEGGKLAVRKALQRQRGRGLVFIEPKTARSRRTIILGKRAIAAVQAHRDRQAFGRRSVGSEWQDHDLVFCDGFGKPLDPSYQTATFKKVAEAGGLPLIRFHDMRLTAATMLLSKGVHVKLVSEMLGHTTITLTLDTYSHLIAAMHGDAAAAMDAILSA